jgi:N-glycosylase/DNA lyase
MVNQVLDDKHHYPDEDTPTLVMDALNACKEALEPEPMTTTDVITCKMTGKCCMTGEALEQPLTRDWKHTIDERIARDSEFKEALEQPAWQGLTDKEIFNLSQQCDLNHILGLIDYGRAVEQALKEKNDV